VWVRNTFDGAAISRVAWFRCVARPAAVTGAGNGSVDPRGWAEALSWVGWRAALGWAVSESVV